MNAPRSPGATASRVAILIAAYNAEATIARAVQSALDQPEADEVCVIDDASTDATAAVARACRARPDQTLTVLTLPANAGPGEARNAGLAATKAAWIGVLDADDFMLDGRLGRMLAHAADADFIADELIRTPHPADTAPALPAASAAPEWLNFERFVRGNLGKAGHGRDLGFIKPLIKRDFLDQHAIRYRPGMRLGEDYELYARALALGARFRLMPAAGYVSVDRPGSISNRHGVDDLRRLRDCDAELSRIRPLTPAERAALRAHAANVDCRLQWRELIEAVKARDPGAALATFRSPHVAAYLCARLAEQAWLRGLGRARKAPA